jgi:hypothetical protein
MKYVDLIQLIEFIPVFLFLPSGLLLFFEKVIAYYKAVHFCPHEATVRVLRGAHDGFATNIETRVH